MKQCYYLRINDTNYYESKSINELKIIANAIKLALRQYGEVTIQNEYTFKKEDIECMYIGMYSLI